VSYLYDPSDREMKVALAIGGVVAGVLLIPTAPVLALVWAYGVVAGATYLSLIMARKGGERR